jgi:hypothetical protein
MEMEMEVSSRSSISSVSAAIEDDLGIALERLNAAAGLIEQAAGRFAGIELNASLVSPREQQLEQRLAEAEATIVSLRAEGIRASARKTAPAGAPALASRDGVAVEASALDSSLRSLSIEQRIAVKAEMLRTGLLA